MYADVDKAYFLENMETSIGTAPKTVLHEQNLD